MERMTNDLPLIDSYDALQNTPPGTRVQLSDLFKKSIASSNSYDEFVVASYAGVHYVEIVRQGIVASYTTNGLGYLIQETPEGYRYVFVESGEDDVFGPLVATKYDALVAARNDWHATGTSGDDWDTWSRELARAVELGKDENRLTRVLEVLAHDPATTLLKESERERLAELVVQAIA